MTYTATLPAGSKLRASTLAALSDPPTDYSASLVLGAATTPPTKGNSVYTAEYRRIGGWIDYTFSVTIGSTFSAGSGTYRFPVPVAATGNKKEVGRAYVVDQGTGVLTGVVVFSSSSDTWLTIVLANATAGGLGAGGPGTVWAATDIIQGTITYLAA